MNYIRGESQNKQVAVVVHKGQDLTSLGGMGQGSLPPLTVTKGDTANLLAQKLPLLSNRLTEQLKYWDTVCPAPRGLPKAGRNNKQGENI